MKSIKESASREERLRRNRQAQQCFRERRTAHIISLETRLAHRENELRDLQRDHRVVREEHTLGLYKNSLLERMLFEKGE